MPLEVQLKKLMLDAVTVEPRIGIDPYTQPLYGLGVAYQCRIEGAVRQIRMTDNTVKISNTTIYLAGDYGISPMDRVTLPDGTQPPILRADAGSDDSGPYIQVLYT